MLCVGCLLVGVRFVLCVLFFFCVCGLIYVLFVVGVCGVYSLLRVSCCLLCVISCVLFVAHCV